ncbi:YdcH family protein [Histidinibacterium aquaticum]|uniref:DUF465 domain-containing protein n=1 Tax=Histidinibacterium aquaticum TaxID=2613962 RepID=A0A5J5GQU2_9RHOB|nr:YdcH family protein [Histidinibacterium aquaticum]KAA9009928.1 DUF465 domain-containing protein [Histidinibacterium aquaticum]
MSNTPHELTDDFPGREDDIRALRATDPHFAQLADRYHAVNREVHRAETDVEPVSDEHMTELRKERMRLKDEIAALLAAKAGPRAPGRVGEVS